MPELTLTISTLAWIIALTQAIISLYVLYLNPRDSAYRYVGLSLFLVAHFHNVIIGGTVFGAMAGYTYWFPKAFGFKLNEKWGAFVSIYKQGMLRGCIGTMESPNPLCSTIEDMAQAAAFRDPRFRPIGPEELPYLELEISVLTPLREVKDSSEIQVGRDGILIRQGSCSGVLLPQVASERNWDRITFLEETCRKAGLPKNAWKEPNTKIYIFSADVF